MAFLQQDYGNVDKVFYMDHFYGIYGIGAIILLVFSKYFNKNNLMLFFGGFIIGAITEYLISFLVEVTMHTQWWDYSQNIFSINGRVCLLYSIFWGILTWIFIKKVNPFIDKGIDKIKHKISSRQYKGILTTIMIGLIIDCMLTCFAQDMFITRMVIENNIEVKDGTRREVNYKRMENTKYLSKFINKYWNDEKMIKTFPNMKIEDRNSNIIYLDSLLPKIQPYYKRVY